MVRFVPIFAPVWETCRFPMLANGNVPEGKVSSWRISLTVKDLAITSLSTVPVDVAQPRADDGWMVGAAKRS